MFRKILTGSVLSSAMALASCMNYQTDFSKTDDVRYVYTDDDVVMLNAQSYDTLVVVRSNVSWEVLDNDSPEWITLLPADPCNVDAPAQIVLVPNVSTAFRKATVTVRATGGVNYTNTFIFQQRYSDAPFAVIEGLNEKIGSDTYIRILKSGGEIPFLFSSNAACALTTDASWCRVKSVDNPGALSGNVLTLGIGAKQQLFIEVDNNATGDVRWATVSIALADGSKTFMKYSIFQLHTDDANAPILTVANDDNGLVANWNKVEGVTSYRLTVYDKAMNLIKEVDCGDVASCDLANFAIVTGNATYMGDIILNVKAGSVSSNNMATNSHFYSGNGGSAADPFVVTCKRHVNNINGILANAMGYKYYKLGSDIDYKGDPFSPIGLTRAMPFIGDFDGAGYTIAGSSMSLSGSDFAYAFFGWVANPDAFLTSKIYNINFDRCTATFRNNTIANNVAVFAIANCVAYNIGAEIDHINANNPVLVLPSVPTGGGAYWVHMAAIVGQNGADDTFTGSVSHCHTAGGNLGWPSNIGVAPHGGNNNNNQWFTAGIVAMNDPYCTVSYCGNHSTTVDGRYLGAGVVGYNEGIVSHCYNEAPISGTVIVGGVVGGKSLTSGTATQPWPSIIEYCRNEGYVFFSPGNLQTAWGGVVGGEVTYTAARGVPTFLRTSNLADDQDRKGFVIRNCYNSGSLTYDASSDGGGSGANRQSGIGSIVGHVYFANISDCYNTGRLFVDIKTLEGNTSPTRVGGLVGFFCGASGFTPAGVTMTRCYQAGMIEWTPTFPSFCRMGIVAGERYTAPNVSIGNIFYLDAIQSVSTSATPSGNAAVGDGKTNGALEDITMVSDAQMADQSTFTVKGWDFTSTWVMGSGAGVDAYPKLQGVGGH